MTTQTEAERLAELLMYLPAADAHGHNCHSQAAAELRRLVSFNQQLMDEVARLTEALAEQPAQQSAERGEPVAYMVKAHGMLQRLSRRVDVADEIACQYRKDDPNAEVFPLYTTPQAQPAREPLTDEQPVSSADELPKGFIPLQQENGTIVYAACFDRNARHYKWLMWKHPDGQWVGKRKLEEWEVMQAEDQEHYGIILGTAAHGITKGNT